MEDVGKIRYLVTDKAGRKLRRAVPKALQVLAGRTAWVERVEGVRASEVRECSAVAVFAQVGDLFARFALFLGGK